MADPLYTVRTPDGLELGPVRRETIIDLLKDRKLNGSESISRDGGAWEPIGNASDFKEAVAQTRQSAVTHAVETDLNDLPEPELTEEQLEIVEEAVETSSENESFSLDLSAPSPAPSKPAKTPSLEESISAAEVEDALELAEEVPQPAAKKAAASAELEVIEPIEEADTLDVPSEEEVIGELKNANNRYTIRDSDGLVLGPVRIATIRDLIMAGKITNKDYIQKNQADWTPIVKVPELYYLLDRLTKGKK